ncbi:amidase signature domain-containing protein [Ilyonectria sp. MPI-CAGE-AT-0026]|nr:amidase signature domain-containing protein [Ilyonectria sp. MPI-CAGE-AT-0026]
MTPNCLERAAEKRAKRNSLIPSEWRLTNCPSIESVPNALEYIRNSDLLTSEELAITETYTVPDLLRRLSQGEISSLKVTKAFAKRAALAQQLNNCCTEIFFDDAFTKAKELDEYLKSTGKTVGPLHGLPISVKDCIHVKGLDSTLGWMGFINKPAPEDSSTAKTLRKLGAVLYVKTNVPQSLMMSDSNNFVFGQCVNPLNRRLISGGSSGGEGTLVATCGSPLGIGTDIGGSIRIPAALCGLYGLSPTYSRHPYERGGSRQNIVLASAGPIATSLASIEAYMQTLPYAEPWKIDPNVVPLPWRTDKCTIPPNQKLKIGFIIDDGVVKPQPPIARATKEVVDSLRSAGHEVTEWDATCHAAGFEIFEKAVLSDGGATAKKILDASGEPFIEGMYIGTAANLLTTPQTHKLCGEKYAFEVAYLQRWKAADLDALIMPVTPWVGYKPWTWVKSHQYVGYTSIWNLLDWAALTLPVTKVSKEKDQPLGSGWLHYNARNPSDEFNKQQYEFDLVEGMPVGVQIVCGKYEDEKCIAVAKIVNSLIKNTRS